MHPAAVPAELPENVVPLLIVKAAKAVLLIAPPDADAEFAVNVQLPRVTLALAEVLPTESAPPTLAALLLVNEVVVIELVPIPRLIAPAPLLALFEVLPLKALPDTVSVTVAAAQLTAPPAAAELVVK